MIILVSTVSIIFIILVTVAMIYWAIQAVRFVEFLRQQQCTHPNLEEKKWVEDSGICMVHHQCPDCNFSDQNHVHADPRTWLD